MASSQTTASLSVGDPAPDFELYTHKEEAWRLSDHRGTPVVLLFFPGAFTSVCTTELNTVSNDLHEYGEAEVVGISTDSPFALAEFHEAEGFSLPLLSDHNAEVSEQYGAKYDSFTPMGLNRVAKRAAFVIDADGTIQYEEVLENAGNQPDLDQIKTVVNDLSGA